MPSVLCTDNGLGDEDDEHDEETGVKKWEK